MNATSALPPKAKSILDPAFRYTSSAETTPEYLRAKFKRILREMKKDEGLVEVLESRHE